MRKVLTALMIAAALMFVAAPATADWDQTQGHKMHFPQMPNPNGWDVNFMDPIVVADDWKCTETGYVEDIHFWISSYHDMDFIIDNIHASIHKDIPAGTGQIPYSRPGSLEWERDFPADQFTVRDWGQPELQGWYEPQDGQIDPANHYRTFQVNIADIANPYVQEEGTIYWLDLSLKGRGAGGFGEAMLGWKTSLQTYQDTPVYRIDDGSGTVMDWEPLPVFLEGDMAFVINGNPVPEPSTLVLTTVGLLGLAGVAAWRRRGKA